MMRSLFFATLFAAVSASAEVSNFEGFVSVDSGTSLYVKAQAPKPAQPTVVLLNGLDYDTTNWESMTKFLLDRGLGVVRFDFQGMGQTLLKYAPATAAFPYQAQVENLHALLAKLDVPKPYNLVGLSYGGGIAQAYAQAYPQECGRIVLFSPYTRPLPSQDRYIKEEVAANRLAFPLNPATDDELYDYFLEQLVLTTYPAADPALLSNPYKLEATFHLVQGIRHFDSLAKVANLPGHSVHLIVAANDEVVPRDQVDALWKKLPATVRMSRVVVQYSPHKMPEAFPQFAASWVFEVLTDANIPIGGRDFLADPNSGVVTYPGGELCLFTQQVRN